jgi:hypothetical protein
VEEEKISNDRPEVNKYASKDGLREQEHKSVTDGNKSDVFDELPQKDDYQNQLNWSDLEIRQRILLSEKINVY